jgi:phospholipase/carboxylesterase
MMDARAWWLIDVERLQMQLMSGRVDRLATEVPDGLAEARRKILGTLDALERGLGVPPGQTVLGGFSQGAMLSTDVMLRGGRKLAGVVLWSGTIIAENEWQPLLSTTAGQPVLQSHGVMDPLLPFEQAERLRDHLLGAGAKLDFVAFRGGHEIPELVLDKTSTFLQRVLLT